MTGSLATGGSGIGIAMFMSGGLAGALFYLPLKKVRKWAWESYWLVYALSGLLIVPWVITLVTSQNVLAVLEAAPRSQIIYCLICGALWGVGGLTYGLMIRYLGVGLGLAMGLGLTSAAGTLIPPLLKGKEAVVLMFATAGGVVSVVAALVSVAGIALVGLAGKSKENELPLEEKKKAVAEFDFRKGLFFAILSGITSSAMSFGLQGGPDLQKLALNIAPPTSLAWAGMPVLVTVLFGGLLVNGIWCVILNLRNKTTGDYVKKDSPILANVLLAALSGAIWCLQFVFLKIGEPRMGSHAYIGWAVLMGSSIFFSQIIGMLLGEWKGVSGKTKGLLLVGLVLLVGSAVLAGFAGSLG